MVQERPPCDLPQWPKVPVITKRTQGNDVLLSRSDIGELWEYIAGIYAWAQAAQICLK